MLTSNTQPELHPALAGELMSSDSEMKIISAIAEELLRQKEMVSNKDIIRVLIEHLELETDVVKLDIYRSALEMVLSKTHEIF